MTSFIHGLPLASWPSEVAGWLLNSLLYGTVLAILTGFFLLGIRRRLGRGVQALLWLIVLVKFVIPLGPSWHASMASHVDWARRWAMDRSSQQASASSAAVPLTSDNTQPPANADGSSMIILLVLTAAKAAQDIVTPAPTRAGGFPYADAIGWTYLAVIAFVAVRGIRRHRLFDACCRTFPPADEATRAVVADACSRLGVSRTPDTRICNEAPAPYIYGVLRPMLVLPERLRTNSDELEAVVLHEIAHLRRGDLITRHLQWVAGTLLFFWPVVAWVNRRIDLAREAACDEWALRHGRLGAADYARCLVRALRPARSPYVLFAPSAMAANRKTVERRIEMIFEFPSRNRSRVWAAAAAMILLPAWGFFVLTGSAQARVAPGDAPAKGAAVSNDAATVTVVTTNDDDATPNGGASLLTKLICAVHGSQGVTDKDVHVDHLDNGQIRVTVNKTGSGGAVVSTNGTTVKDGQCAMMVAVRLGESDEDLAKFLADQPTADANGDGKLSESERGAYLVAVAMSNPAAVMQQYPDADRNHDGLLGADEAARLLGGMGTMTKFVAGGPMMFTAEAVGAAGGDSIHEININLNTDAKDDASTDPVSVTTDKDVSVVVGVPALKMKLDPDADGQAGDIAMWTAAAGAHPFGSGAGEWVLANINVTPAAATVAQYVPAVEEAPLAAFLEHHPEADTNADGRLSTEERDAFIGEMTKEIRPMLLKDFPSIDKDGDGQVSDEEMKAFHESMGAEGPHMLIKQLGVAADAQGGAGGNRVFVRKLHNSLMRSATDPNATTLTRKIVVTKENGKVHTVISEDHGDGEVVVEDKTEDDVKP